MAVEDGAFQRAVPLLEKVIASDPGIHIAQLNLGIARARQKQYTRAITPLRKAIALQPEVMIAHYELALALYETGDLEPPRATFRSSPGVCRNGPTPDTRSHPCTHGLIGSPRRSQSSRRSRARAAALRANLLLGRILTLQGQAAAAVDLLHVATSVQPSSAEAYQFLADAYEKSGRPAEAADARRRAAALMKK